MKTINASIELKQLDGKPVQNGLEDPTPMTIGRAIANLLAMNKARKFDNFKAFELAGRFYAAGNVELDDADFNKLKEVVKADDSYHGLILGQIEKALNEVV